MGRPAARAAGPNQQEQGTFVLHRSFSIAWVLWALLLVATAQAQQPGDVAAAANAFAQAQRAELSGDHARAAELYELADRIAPTPEAVRNATRAWLAAGRNVSAATLAEELLRRYSEDATSRELAEEVLQRTRPSLARIRVQCSDPCTLLVNGLAAGTDARASHVVYLEPGAHNLTARFEGGETQSARVDARASETTQLTLVPPAAPAAPAASAGKPSPEQRADSAPSSDASPSKQDEAKARRGLHPAYFWSGLGATLALGAVTLWSGLDLLDARDAFKADPNPTREAFEDGERKDLRTSILIGTSAALAVGTAVLGVFTDFRRQGTEAQAVGRVSTQRAARSAPGFSADARGARLLWTGTF
jgi:hypothetical protein